MTDEWEEKVKQMGLAFLDEIPFAEEKDMGKEITEWLQNHKIKAFRCFYYQGDCDFVVVADNNEFITFSANDMGLGGVDTGLGWAAAIKSLSEMYSH